MQTHPFINSVLCRMAGVALAVVSCSISALLLYYYGHTGWLVAWLDSLVLVGIFCVSGFLFWYVTGILRPLQAQIALAVGVLIISVTGGYMAGALVYPDRMDWFASTIPFRILLGLLGWIILAQWYYIRWKELQMEIQEEQRKEEREEENAPAETGVSSPEEEAILDRISVKDGSRIHLIHLEELLYIQASGDYVALFTTDGQYIKDQTMKYFESHLPANLFIRIHRSCIVNSEQIMRVELFGKESYQVRLKTGVCLRASLTGYKLLKERLSL